MRTRLRYTLTLVCIALVLALPAGSGAVEPGVPAGERIVFIAKLAGDPYSVYMARLNGTGIKRLSDEARSKYSVSMSPSGTHAVYAEWYTCTELVLLRVRDAKATRLTHNDFCDVSPRWSPDGKRIVFASDRKEPGESVPGVPGSRKTAQNDYNIYVMRADGEGKARRLDDYPRSDSCPAWSPDGSKIAFSSHRHLNQDIYLMDADGSNVERLTNNPAPDWCPMFSPDGSRIMFTTRRHRTDTERKNSEIYVMDADGSSEKRLTDDAAEDDAADWSPHGTRILFWSGRSEDGGLFIMDADGGNVQPFGSLGRTYGGDWWAPPS